MSGRKSIGNKISRRDFLKAGIVLAGGIALTPTRKTPALTNPPAPRYIDPFPRQPDYDMGILGRIATYIGIDVYAKPRDDSEIVGKRFRDQIVHIYDEISPPGFSPDFNWKWYRVWGGYMYSAHVQKVKINLNEPATSIPETGMLAEVTVPYSTAMQNNALQGWITWRGSRLYYGSTHWLTGIIEGPDNTPWYQITSELAKSEKYFAPARHFRIIPQEEFSPIRSEIPVQHKRIEVSIDEQMLRAYEYNELVYSARVSTGIPTRVPEGALPTATPKGEFRIYAKQPSKHMGSVAGGPEVEASDGFSLPGVPWTSFFKNPGGYAIHGTYWHNNYGMQMSHGCVNMSNEDALWIFRWNNPPYDPEINEISDWEQTGYGTLVRIS